MEPIRVLQVLGSLNNGGSQAMIMNVYRNINREKVQFDFIIDKPGEVYYKEEILRLGGRVYELPRYRGKNHFSYVKAWHNFFKEHREYKIIHGHVRSTATIYLSIAKKYGLRSIIHSHSTSSGVGISSVVKNILQYPLRYTVDNLFTCSEEAGKWLYGNKVSTKKNYKIIKNAIEAEKYIIDPIIRKEKRIELGIDDRLVIGHIGRFAYPKNHEFLLEVFKSIQEKREDATLLLVGDGELKRKIEEDAALMGISDKVIFTGARSDIPDLLQVMDIFVFPSHFEGLGIVVVEAQAAGIRCIVSDAVPQEVFMTDLVEGISLKDGADYWAEKTLENVEGYEKRNTYKEIVAKGYDISESVSWLEKFYISEVRRC
ncbi:MULTISPECIES: glycosyltransferase family 1 protein [Bacillus]|uniref:glycosyltransferase family 1 protein n=1 Tax=Bacillus TaxID=1386 RepID=UPI000A986577|nr:glycosyltransferase family 1 protein [Bacillus cereus]ASI86345.1 capsular polysaccharide biosynthesis protein [Bacillus cereus]MCU5332766.1 glycosyltransferase family 1 protein [Bacillus cereus]MDW4538610.1 glycosyltransferase family 1 protein [Bacillus cereus]MDZ4553439.1 glycosyltransferase family 1 protein [Bacillus cereus]